MSTMGVRLGLIVGLLATAACKEPNPDFDGSAEAGGSSTGPAGTTTTNGPDTNAESTGPAVTGDGTTGGTSSGDPGTSSGDPGTSSGEPGGSTTESCAGMVCEGECIDPQTNNDHCGMCDNNCVGQQECIDGECMVP